jgi:PAS domain S-box-containing protein
VELFRKTQQIKRQADELAETTAFLNSVLEGSTEYAIAALDLDGQILAWNDGARRTYGYTAEEIIGKHNIRRLHTPEDVAAGKVDALLKAAARSGKAEGEFERVRKNGRRFSTSTIISRRTDARGMTIGFVSISRDITAIKRAERERVQLVEEQAARVTAEVARDRLQQVVDVLPVGIAIADADGRIHLSNAAGQDLLGQRPVSAAPDPSDRFQILFSDGTPCPPDELPLARAVFRAELVRGAELQIRSAVDDRQVPVLVNAAPLRAPDGSIAGGVVAFLDISPLKELEQQKDAFLAAVSHDLKNPLSAITAWAQLLQRQATKLTVDETPRIVAGLEAIDRATGRVTGMINELLDLSRLRTGRPLDLDRQPVDLVALAHQVASELQPSTEHQLEVAAEPADLVGDWDRARLERVLVNLNSNSVKYSPAGGTVRVEVAREAQDGEEWAVVRVSDRGIGIPEDELPRVFDRFYRGSNVVGKIEGSGIGLAGVRQIVEQHGGRVSAESQEQVGSTFTVRLPLG